MSYTFSVNGNSNQFMLFGKKKKDIKKFSFLSLVADYIRVFHRQSTYNITSRPAPEFWRKQKQMHKIKKIICKR